MKLNDLYDVYTTAEYGERLTDDQIALLADYETPTADLPSRFFKLLPKALMNAYQGGTMRTLAERPGSLWFLLLCQRAAAAGVDALVVEDTTWYDLCEMNDEAEAQWKNEGVLAHVDPGPCPYVRLYKNRRPALEPLPF